MSGYALLVRYCAFAILATIANLGTQRAVLAAGDHPSTYAMALIAGTLVGLVAKYALDKRWIFADPSSGLAAHGRKFTLYSLMGLVTTMIFWGTETAFWLAWQNHSAREAGALLGLAIGYCVKYHLDRRYVFVGSLGKTA